MRLGSYPFGDSRFSGRDYTRGILFGAKIIRKDSRLNMCLAVVSVIIMLLTSFAIIDFSTGHGSSSLSSISPYSQTSSSTFYLNQSDKASSVLGDFNVPKGIQLL